MNRLSTEKRPQVLGCLVEGMSIRATVRVTEAAKNTVVKLLAEAGAACADFQDAPVRNLDTKRVECDEIWSFCYSKQKNVPEDFKGTPGYGDIWTWVAIDADTKLIPTWLVGERTTPDCYTFLRDLKDRLKPGQRIQLTTDGFGSYPPVVSALWQANIDYAVMIKDYTDPTAEERRRYSPATCKVAEVRIESGDPDPMKLSTSYVERNNLTMRMGMRRFTRLTNAFSKKVENHAHAISLHFMHYNFCRTHQTLSKKAGKPTTPAMAAGLEDHPWSLTQLCELLESN
jgi:IS1 family transposase